jgi:hypothetical protein
MTSQLGCAAVVRPPGTTDNEPDSGPTARNVPRLTGPACLTSIEQRSSNSRWTETRLARSCDKNRTGYLAGSRQAGNRRKPSQRVASRASTAISAVKGDVDGTSQARHSAGIPCCSSRGGRSPAARNVQRDKEPAGQRQVPTKSPQLTGPTSQTRIDNLSTFLLVRGQFGKLSR